MSIDPSAHLKVAIPYDAVGFNEVWRNVSGAAGYFVGNNIFSRLVILDVFDTGEIAPDLAERWDILDDGARYIFHLNPRARWHDGAPATAHDVAYTYGYVLEHGGTGLPFLQDIAAVRALGDHTVECVLQAPNSAFLAQLGLFVLTHILPRHLYEGTDWADNPHNVNPVGSGPFKIKQWIEGQRVELTANHDYWRAGPYVERLTYEVIPDGSEALEALAQGDVHFDVKGILCRDYSAWKQKPGCDVFYEPGNATAALTFNFTRDTFQDHRVREAFARLIDRRKICDALCDLATPQNHFYLEKVTWAFNPDARAPEHDRAIAAQLLDAAGFPRDADGMRLRLGLATRALYEHYGMAAELLKAQFAAVGVELVTEALSPTAWKERILDNAEFDLILDSVDIGPDPQLMASILASDGPRNAGRYRSAAVDDCLRLGRATVDRAERGAHYKRLQAVLAEDLPRVPLLQYGEFLPYRTEFTGWSWSDGVRGTLPFWSHAQVRPRTAKG